MVQKTIKGRTIRFPFALLCSFFFLGGCSEENEISSPDVSGVAADKKVIEQDIEGQVFIVTRGGENVKLGLVKVYFIPDKAKDKIVADDNVQSYFSKMNGLGKQEGDAYVRERAREMAFASLGETMSTLFDKVSSVKRYRTDADGKFNGPIEAGSYWVFASSKRSVPGSDQEIYVWLTRLNIDGDSNTSVILSNDTLVSSFTKFYIEFCSIR
ncbi:hypothetical protein N9A74_07185 [Akkermansiaceae bacterium]|nr:hypothetical protein [Akkermansiaceae bacterium]